jgi:hypothetical protein
MAKRPALIGKKSKTIRVTKSEQYIVNKKYLGDEPMLKENFSDGEFANALTWYNYMCTTGEARDYIKEYLKSKGRLVELKMFNRVPDAWVPSTAAWVARMMVRGNKIKPDSISFFERKLSESISKAATVVEPNENKQDDKVVVSVQQRMREKASDLIGDIEQLIDSGEQFSLYDWLKARNVPAAYMQIIVNYYAPWLDELLEAFEGPDAQLKEAYSHLTKKQLRDRVTFFSKIIEDAEKYGSVTKKTRAPRKPRTVSIEKKLKNLKFQKEDKTFKIASVNPEKIIGAQELWTFNTKYKTLSVFRALDRGGLQIKGTTLIGYDEQNSFTKRTGRKPEEYVKKVLDGGKLVLRKVMEGLKDAPLAFRINENTILLRVI